MTNHDNVPKESRLASRVILIDQHQRILYLRATEPKTGCVFWVMPGGGLEVNESFEEAAIREAHEESGCVVTLGPYVWFRRHKDLWNGKPFDQYERFFVAWVSESTYNPSRQDAYISQHKWWSLNEVLECTDDFAPRNIREIIPPILSGLYPEEPFDCGI